MPFNSLSFAAFFAAVYPLYLVLAHRRQNELLLLASYVFYALWDWRFIPLLLFSSAVAYGSGRALSKASPGARRGLLWASIALEVAPLLGFKYFGPLLPLGISYYTFQAISYTVDIYNRRVEASSDFVEFALFKAFFPTLFGGPIERAGNLLKQIQSRRALTTAQLEAGVFLFGWGLFKKVAIADNLAPIVNSAFRATPGSALEAWAGLYAFAFQVYGDFSGYSDMAQGLGLLMGFQLVTNFNLPFLARNPIDFWKRWHVSLSGWFADYVCDPVFYATKSMYLALFLALFLNGLWHGATLNFVALGAYNGLVICAYALLRSRLRPFLEPESAGARRAVAIASVVAMFHVTCFGFLLFRAPTLEAAGLYLRALVSGGGSGFDSLMRLAYLLLPLFAMEVFQARGGSLAYLKIPGRLRMAASLAAIYAVGLYFIYFSAVTDRGKGFIYFQF